MFAVITWMILDQAYGKLNSVSTYSEAVTEHVVTTLVISYIIPLASIAMMG